MPNPTPEPSSLPDLYTRDAHAYAAATLDLDTAPLRMRFLHAIPSASAPVRILDVGPGSGRDARAFRALGYTVRGIDASSELARIASAFAGVPVSVCRVQDLNQTASFEGIWACASLLHVPRTELPDAFDRLAQALVPRGVLYASFKWGTQDSVVDGRHFTNLEPEALRSLLRARPEASPTLDEVDLWQTADVRKAKARTGEAWLNVLLRRRA